MSGKVFQILMLVYTFNMVERSIAIEDYCSLNTYEKDDDSEGMHFTKEANNKEFAIVGKFKGLHCCAKGYKYIEWYKDGRPYPWDLDLSSLIIFPESANQTVYTQTIKKEDSGNYTCILRDERGNITEVYTHTISLKVFDKLPDDPQITYVSEDKEAYRGDAIRLFCEAFSGSINLPDAHNEVVWYKELTNGTLVEVPERILQDKSSREDGQTYGTHMIITDIKSEDYGSYICVISKPGNTINKRVIIREKMKAIKYVNPNPFPLKAVLIVSGICIVLLTSVLVLIKQFGLKAQVVLKDSLGSIENNDGKSHDVLVAYAAKDTELAVGTVIPQLRSRDYQCVTMELSHDASKWAEELQQQAEKCRRIICLLSPAALDNSWTPAILYQSLKQLQNVTSSKVITVVLKSLPPTQGEVKNSSGETLGTVIKSSNVITWKGEADPKFWLNICRELPAKRGSVANPTNIPRLTRETSIDHLIIA